MPALHEPESVPYLVCEIAPLLRQGVVIQEVVACRGAEHHADPYSVSTVFFYQVKGLRRVAERFRHLTPLLITYKAGQIDIAERFSTGVLIPCNDHPCNPEKEYLGSSDQVVGRIIIFQFLIAGIIYPVEGGNRPEPRREPGIEHILILPQVGLLQAGIAALFPCELKSLGQAAGDNILIIVIIPCRYLVAPPQLPAYAPVADILHPVAVKVFELGRVQLYLPVHYGIERRT